MEGQQRKPQEPLPPEQEDEQLFAQCRAFLAIAVPKQNIVLESEFGKFMPLFNNKLREQVESDDLNKLCQEYFRTFSMQHPIQILSNGTDPSGRGPVYPGDNRSHHLVQTIPAIHRRVNTLNELGEKVPTLINALFNSTVSKKNNPLVNNQGQYADSIGKAVAMANAKDPTMKQKREEFAAAEKALVSRSKEAQGDQPQQPEGSPSNDESCETGLIDWGS